MPSQTELLHALGLSDKIVGITKFCIHPRPWVDAVTKIGGTKKLRHADIAALSPDLIVANKEENTREDIEKLRDNYPVWTSDINSWNDATEMIVLLGEICGRKEEGQEMVAAINSKFNFRHSLPPTAYLIWNQPLMAVGSGTFIHAMMEKCGFVNAFSNTTRYPETTAFELLEKGVELLLLSSEPFPFAAKHKEALQRELPGVRIVLVDGEMFSWYGNRMLMAADYMQDLITQLSKH